MPLVAGESSSCLLKETEKDTQRICNKKTTHQTGRCDIIGLILLRHACECATPGNCLIRDPSRAGTRLSVYISGVVSWWALARANAVINPSVRPRGLSGTENQRDTTRTSGYVNMCSYIGIRFRYWDILFLLNVKSLTLPVPMQWCDDVFAYEPWLTPTIRYRRAEQLWQWCTDQLRLQHQIFTRQCSVMDYLQHSHRSSSYLYFSMPTLSSTKAFAFLSVTCRRSVEV